MRTQPNKQQPRVYVLRSRAPLLGPLSRHEQQQWLDYHRLSQDNSSWGRAQFRIWLGQVSPLVLSRMAELDVQRGAQTRRVVRARQLRATRQQADARLGFWIFVVVVGFNLALVLGGLLGL
jgi:hypothetical protein